MFMRFTCCLKMAFSLTKPICLHDVTPKSVAALTDHFADAFVRENAVRVYDIVVTFREFDTDAILFREIQCKKRDILMFKGRFQCGLG